MHGEDAACLRNGEAGNGETGDEVGLEEREGVARHPVEDGEEVLTAMSHCVPSGCPLNARNGSSGKKVSFTLAFILLAVLRAGGGATLCTAIAAISWSVVTGAAAAAAMRPALAVIISTTTVGTSHTHHVCD